MTTDSSKDTATEMATVSITGSETTILGIAGSLRRSSYNRVLLAQAQALAPAGTLVVVWDRLADVPPFNEDAEDDPGPVVIALRDAIGAADAVLIATPEYNGSIPGQLKNALDWASRPYADNVLRGKTVAVIGASPSPGGARHAQAATRSVLGRIGATVLDDEVAVARAYEGFDEAGRLSDPDQQAALTRLVERLGAAE